MSQVKAIITADTSGLEAGVNRAKQALGKIPNASNQATLALSNLSRVAQDAPYGFIGIANNINPLLESFQRLKATTGTTGGALKSMVKELTGPAGIGLAVGVVSSLLVTFGDRLFGAGKKADDAKKQMDDFNNSVKSIIQTQAKEITEITGFIAVLKSETETRQRKLAAIKELQRIQPEVFAGLKLEGNAIIGLDSAYKQYIANISKVVEAKIKMARLEQITARILELEGKTLSRGQREYTNAAIKQLLIKRDQGRLSVVEAAVLDKILSYDKERVSLLEEQKELASDLVDLSSGIEVKMPSGGKIKVDKVKFDFTDSIISGIEEAILRRPIELRSFKIPTNALFTGLEEVFERARDWEKKYGGKLNILKPITPDLSGVNEVISKNQAKALEELRNQWMETANAISSVVSPAFNEFIDSISKGENAFRAFGDLVANVLKAVAAQLLQTAILAGILSIVSGGGLSFAAAFKQVSGFKAAGGPVGAGGSYIVGERGPELFVPSTQGRIVPNHNLGSLAGGALQAISVRGTFVQRGRDLVAVVASENRYQGRNV